MEHDTSRSHGDAPATVEPDWSAIAASLDALETGLHKVDADLGRIRADLEAFRLSLKDLDEA